MYMGPTYTCIYGDLYSSMVNKSNFKAVSRSSYVYKVLSGICNTIVIGTFENCP